MEGELDLACAPASPAAENRLCRAGHHVFYETQPSEPSAIFHA